MKKPDAPSMSDPTGDVFKVTHEPSEPDPRTKAVFAAVARIVEKHGRGIPADDIAGRMPCTLCEAGTLHYTVSSYNGHRWGTCTTPGCLDWME